VTQEQEEEGGGSTSIQPVAGMAMVTQGGTKPAVDGSAVARLSSGGGVLAADRFRAAGRGHTQVDVSRPTSGLHTHTHAHTHAIGKHGDVESNHEAAPVLDRRVLAVDGISRSADPMRFHDGQEESAGASAQPRPHGPGKGRRHLPHENIASMELEAPYEDHEDHPLRLDGQELEQAAEHEVWVAGQVGESSSGSPHRERSEPVLAQDVHASPPRDNGRGERNVGQLNGGIAATWQTAGSLSGAT